MSRWEKFIEKLKDWADSESNGVNLRFTVSPIDPDTVKIKSQKANKIFCINYTRKEYEKTIQFHDDNDIYAMLFQTLREKYRNLFGKFSMNYYPLRKPVKKKYER